MRCIRRLLACNPRRERGHAADGTQLESINRKLARIEQSLELIRALMDLRENKAAENAAAIREAMRRLGEIDSLMGRTPAVSSANAPTESES